MGWQDDPVVGGTNAKALKGAAVLSPAMQAHNDYAESLPGNQPTRADINQRARSPAQAASIADIPSSVAPAPFWASDPVVSKSAAPSPDDEVAPRTGAAQIPTAAEAAGQPYQPPGGEPYQPPSFEDKVTGAVEAAVNLGSSLAGGIAGMIALPFVGEKGMNEIGGGVARGLKRMVHGPMDLTEEDTEDTDTGEKYTRKFVNPILENLAPLGGHMADLGALHSTAGPAIPQAASKIGPVVTRATPSVVKGALAEGAAGRGAARVLGVDPELAKVAQTASELKYPVTVRPDQVIKGAKYTKLAGQASSDVPFSGSKNVPNQEAFTRNVIDVLNPEETAERLSPTVFADAMDRSGKGIGDIMERTDVPLDKPFSDALRELRDQVNAKESPDNARIINSYIDDVTSKAEADGVIDGTALRKINTEIGGRARTNYASDLGTRLNDLQGAIEDAVQRNVSEEDGPALKDFRRQYAYGKILEPIVAKTINGLVPPSQLMGAVTRTGLGKHLMANAKGGPIGDLAKVGQLIKEPASSGTAERGLLYGGALGGLGYVEPHTAGALYGGANLYNRGGPALTRAMVGKRPPKVAKLAPEAPEPPPEPTTSPGAGEPPSGGGGAPPGPLGDEGGGTPPAPPNPRLAEVERLGAENQSPAVQSALKEHAADIAKQDAARADVEALEQAAHQTTDPELQARLQAKADKLRQEEKIPAGEAKEGQPAIKVEKTGKVPSATVEPLKPEVEAAWRKAIGDGDFERMRNLQQALAHDEPGVIAAQRQHERSPVAFDREIARINEKGAKDANEAQSTAGGSADVAGNAPAPVRPNGAPNRPGAAAPVPAERAADAGSGGASVLGQQERGPAVPAAGRSAEANAQRNPVSAVRAAGEQPGAERAAAPGTRRLADVSTGGQAPDNGPTRRAGAVERRADIPTRKAVAEMSHEERGKALLVDDMTGLGNRRAYEEVPKRAVQASLDVDGLKAVNDLMSHQSGDALITKLGEALKKAGVDAYHISGDEFVAQFDDAESGHAAMQKVREALSDATISIGLPDGSTMTKQGVDFSYGLGKDLATAERGLQADKTAREASGLRSPRGGEPRGMGKALAPGKQDQVDRLPQEVKPRLFKTRGAAEAERDSLGNTHKLQKVKDGWILRLKSDAEVAAGVKAGQRLKRGTSVDVDKDSLLKAIAKMGGLAMKERDNTITEGNRNVGGRMLFTERGMPLERMVQALDEDGYIPTGEMEHDGGVSWLQSAISDEFGGHATHYSMNGEAWMRQRGEEAEPLAHYTMDDLDQAGYSDAPPNAQALTEQLLAEAQGLGIDTKGITREAALQSTSEDEYHANIQKHVEEILAQARKDAAGGKPEGAQGGSADRGQTPGAEGKGVEGGADSEPDDQSGGLLKEAGQENAPVGTPEALEAALLTKFPAKVIEGLKAQGILKYAAGEGRKSSVKAMTQPEGPAAGATLYFDRLNAKEAPGVLMHELGEHYGINRLLGEERYRIMLNELAALKEKAPEVGQAWEEVRQSYTGARSASRLKEGDPDFLREVAAHLVESHPDLPFVRRLVNEIRAFFYEHFGTTMGNSVDANLVRGLAASALRKASQGELPKSIPQRRAFRPFVASGEARQ